MGKPFKSLRGQLLLDGGKLYGSFFHQTVVLICEHDPQGAFGLVLNRRGPVRLGDAVVAQLPERIRELPLYIGGPVQTTALSYLHSDLYLTKASVMPNLNLDHSLDSLIELADSYSPTQKIKVFAGYAGWAPGQLDDEMRRKAWLTHPASLDLIFYDKPELLWREILRQKGFQYKLLAESPEDLSLN
jgi:putative transcriptional regulator